MKDAITGIILCGGLSSRMGTDKGLMMLNGKQLIEYPVQLLKQYCTNVLISSNTNNYMHFGLQIVPDYYHSIGPIGGLYSGLLASKTDDNLFLACDMPFVDNEIVELIIRKKEIYDAVVVSIDNWAIPVCGYYNKSIIGILKNNIENERYSLQNVLSQAKTLVLEIENIEMKDKLLNINTPDDFKKIKK